MYCAQAAGKFIPEPVSDWGGVDVLSDHAITIMCFAGFAAVRLAEMPPTDSPDQDGAVFQVDVSELAALQVRPGYERYGATAFFDADTKLVRIRWSMCVRVFVCACACVCVCVFANRFLWSFVCECVLCVWMIDCEL